MDKIYNGKKLNSFQIILMGFAGVILIGALLLCLPFSSKSGEWSPFVDSFFTSTSAVCVTGLVIFDTATHWSIFGQIIILLLIQIGGMGIVVVIASLAVLSGKKISLFGRDTIKEALSSQSIGGIVKFTLFIVKGIFIIELMGALIMMPVFCKDFGAEGVWFAVFHAISAFCNAGFDLMGSKTGKFSSLTAYATQPIIIVTITLLIIIGGIGFLVWEDVVKHKFKLKKYTVQSKIILAISLILIILPPVYFFLVEFADKPFWERLALSFFQAVTPRTAGFNTADLTLLSETGLLLMIILMLIGGATGSTAGGMKVTTVTLLFANAISVFRKREDTEIMKRRIDNTVVRNAAAIFLMYITLFSLGATVICLIEGLPLLTCLYESASAIATVGLSLGITPSLGIFSKFILIILMFFGRVGGLTIIYAAFGKGAKQVAKLPIENISVG